MTSTETPWPQIELRRRIFVYEHICGGGLASTSLPPSLREEGEAMLRAILEDLSRLPGVEVVTTVDARLERSSFPGDVKVVGSTEESARLFLDLARSSSTIVIAPETDHVLERQSRRVLEVGGHLLGSEPRAVAVTSDKLGTFRCLDRSGVPALPAVPLASHTSSDRPVVLKPRFGAGSEDVRLVPRGARPEPADGDFVVTPFVPGIAASVLVMVGEREVRPLVPCRQVLSDDGRFRYLGGSAPLPGAAGRLAVDLATRAVRSIPGLRGFTGVDLVMSPDETSGLVVEVNARLTTSYTGLRHLARNNLARCWLETWLSGTPGEPRWKEGEVSFSSSGRLLVASGSQVSSERNL